MSVFIESFMIVVLEMFCCKIFFETFAEKRGEKSILKNHGTIAALIVFVYLAAMFLSNYFLIKQILIIVVTALLMIIYLKMNLGKSIILSAIFQGLLLVLDYLSFLICMSIFDKVFEMEMAYEVQGYLIVLIGKAVLFLVVLLVRKKIGRDSSIILSDADWLRFIFFPLFTICTISAMLTTVRSFQDQKQEMAFFVIAFGLTGMNIVVFYLINDILKRERQLQESQLFQLEVKNQTSMYRSISENFSQQRKKTHEFKNQIVCIDSLIRKKAFNELAEYVSTLSSSLSKEMDYITTHHVIVDAILNTKFQEMMEQNILFVFKINDLSDIKISDEDIVVILSNLLNNAIEACVQCQSEKVIKLKFVNEEESVVISVKNTYEGKIVYDGEEIKSSKVDNIEEHGIGIKNIVETVKKYGGSYAIQDREKESEFYFSILIPH